MRPLRSLSPWAGLSLHGATLTLLASLVSMMIGCGGTLEGEPPKSQALLETQKKVQALAKEGKSLSEIRAIMKGEPPTKKGAKKASRKP